MINVQLIDRMYFGLPFSSFYKNLCRFEYVLFGDVPNYTDLTYLYDLQRNYTRVGKPWDKRLQENLGENQETLGKTGGKPRKLVEALEKY